MEFNNSFANGYTPVELDFADLDLELIRQSEGRISLPILWLLHLPSVGDWIVFQLTKHVYRGKVASRAFEGVDKQYQNTLGVHLLIEKLRLCPHPVEASIWDDDDATIDS